MRVIEFNRRLLKLASCYCKVVVFFTILIAATFATNAQQNLNYSVHANIIYRFTKYIDWPDYKNSGDFIIGIVGYTPLLEELKKFIATKTIGGRKIVVKKMSPLADSYDCQILFIAEDNNKIITEIARITKDRPVLIVTEAGSRASKRSCINFVIDNNHLKLEINKNNIEDRNLNIASELLRLGTIVQ